MKDTYRKSLAGMLGTALFFAVSCAAGSGGQDTQAAQLWEDGDFPVLSDQEDTQGQLFGVWKPEENGTVLPAAQDWLASRLPKRYDARDEGKEPVIKSQGKLGTCWALSAVSALEAALLPEQHLEFSADHLSLQNGFQISQNEGGDYMMIMAYLSGWYGPVPESKDPYGDGYSPEGLAASVHVQEIQMLEGMGQDQIKRMILQYGPVQTSLYMDRRITSNALDYYNEAYAAFYYPEEKTPTHDILILGWDDDYPKEYFKTEPEKDGAYICQNTWGDDFGDGGIFYVSYEDANIAEGGLAYTRVEDADNYDKIYQTDVCGWQGQQGYEAESCYFANVYTAEGTEELKAVGFYTTGSNSSYEIYTVDDFEDTGSFENRILRKSGQIRNKGYYTIDLDEPVELEEGERFAVMVKITTPGASMPVVVELHKDIYTEGVTTEGKEGYLSLTGEAWEFTEEKFQTNVCLKAFTDVRE